MLNEAETRAKLIDPKLRASGWKEKMIEREKVITRGMIINDNGDRLPVRKPDYILYYPDRAGIPIAVIEAKAEDKSHLAGMQQAKEYMERLGVPFAYSTNGHKIEEYDDFRKQQVTLENFPSPTELWRRYVEGKGLKEVIKEEKNPLLYPYYPFPDKPIRYYQEIAVKNAIEAILKGKKRVLLTMATGCGKTYVAFQIVWKLYKTRKIRRVLYLVDRIFLRRQAHDMFFPFGNAREELVGGKNIPKHKDIYFATYQTLYSQKDDKRVYELFEPDFFDMIIIDECHRSGWRRWHDILRYFSNAIHLGLTATPKRDDNIDTYEYFGKPVYDYPMRRGIEDGYLAPCEIIRVFTNIDKAGALNISEVKSYGAKIEVPEGVELKEYYTVEEFEREITLPDRTKKICEHLARVLESTGPKEKTAIFCVSQSHAAEVAKELNNYFGPIFGVSNYAVRVVADEPYAHEILKEFKDSEKDFPVVVTTVDLLSTGVDIPPVRNIVFLKHIDSKVVFHQIIGRGSRIDENAGKFTFRIIDYTNATRLFDEWDLPGARKYEGPADWYLACKIIDAETGRGIPNASVVAILAPSKPVTLNTDEKGSILLKDVPRGSVKIDIRAGGYKRRETTVPTFPAPDQFVVIGLEREVRKKKELIKAENIEVYIVEEGIIKANVFGNELLEAEYIEYCKNGLIKRITTLDQLKAIWKDKNKRTRFKEELKKAGINLNVLSKILKKSNVDEFDLIAHILFNAPILTRDERARALLDLKREIIEKYGAKAREIIFELIDRYRIAGIDEISDPGIFRTPPFDKMGALKGIIKIFGGLEPLKEAIQEIERGLYPEFGGLR
ncbi:MAG: EcoAI/FtnUII family type I restriction enzme subunit R [Candidatus Njordarchaeales archaeon]